MICRSCGADRTSEVLSLGHQHLSDFHHDASKSDTYPLDLMRCADCELVQLRESAPRWKLYHPAYGFKSGVNDSIRRDLKSIVDHALAWKPEPKKWLDIGCNDGTLLSFVPRTVYRVGVDPVKPLIEEGKEQGHISWAINDYFPSLKLYGEKFDVITSVSMFYDVDDLNGFVSWLRSLLAPQGVCIIQQNYLGSMIKTGAVDNIVHEHVTYFGLAPLVRLLEGHGLCIKWAQITPINGGSLRVVVRHKRGDSGWDQREPLPCDLPALEEFAKRAKHNLAELGDFVRGIVADGAKVYIYGASTRGATLWQGAGLNASHLPKAVDRNPQKCGFFYSPVGCPIISEKQAREERPDYMLVGPWFFRDEFVAREQEYLRGGGKLIFPLPKLEVVGA